MQRVRSDTQRPTLSTRGQTPGRRNERDAASHLEVLAAKERDLRSVPVLPEADVPGVLNGLVDNAVRRHHRVDEPWSDTTHTHTQKKRVSARERSNWSESFGEVGGEAAQDYSPIFSGLGGSWSDRCWPMSILIPILDM